MKNKIKKLDDKYLNKKLFQFYRYLNSTLFTWWDGKKITPIPRILKQISD